jgi:hypothetical protein
MKRILLASLCILGLCAGCGATGQICVEFGAGEAGAFQPSVQVDIKACLQEGTPFEQCAEAVLADWAPDWEWDPLGTKTELEAEAEP